MLYHKYLSKNPLKFFSQNKTSLLLMCISVLLLTLFNAFWLRQNYREQQINLQKDVSNIFEKTIASMQDSLIKKQVDEAMKAQKPQKSKLKKTITNIDLRNDNRGFVFVSKQNDKAILKHDSALLEQVSVVANNRKHLSDSMGRRILSSMIKSFRFDSGGRSIKIELKLDSTYKRNLNLPNNVMVMSSLKGEILQTPKKIVPKTITQKSDNIVIKLVNDSLKKAEIREKYSSKLKKQNIILPFALSVSSKEKNIKPSEIGAKATLGLLTYQAIFEGYQWFLTKKIIPQIIFSFFLIAITILSFLLIFRNLQQQRRLTELKNDFVSNVTHELKTPISTVSVAIEALSNFNVLQNPAQTKEYLEISKNELNRLTILVDKVLKMSIFEQKDLALKIEMIDFKALVENVLATMKLQFEKYYAQIDYDFVGNHFSLEGDVIHLTNVVYNLLENALKYSSEPLISIRLTEENQQIKLAIQDNGIGISEEYLPKIFDKFFRVPTGNVHNTKGYGLGLSYVRSVIEKHKGTIAVTSKIGEGSCFIVNFNQDYVK
jgi:two-component system, OmpR family, phosphate regulon sensor histidine kinase PhoR